MDESSGSLPPKTRSSSTSRKKPPTTSIDTGTAELGKRQKLKAERGVGVIRVRSLTTTPLDRLLYQEKITIEDYAIIDDLLADVFRAGLITLKAFDPGKVRVRESARSGEQAQELVDLRQSLRSTMTSLERRTGLCVGDLVFDLLYSPEYVFLEDNMERLSCSIREVAHALRGI